jgi:hypothetical protein
MQMTRRVQAHALLAALAAAALVSVAGMHDTAAVWTEMPYPVGDAKHHVGSSPQVYVEAIGEAGHIGYHTIYRDNVVPAAFAGVLSSVLHRTEHYPPPSACCSA